MNTREIAAEYRLGHWAGLMQERKENGLSIKAFCIEKGFHENVYYYWQRKLREAACAQLAVSGFAEVVVQEPLTLPAPPDIPSSTSQLCVETAGIRIIADSTYPPEKLAALVREITRIC